MSLRFIALFLFVSNSLLDTGHLHILQHFVYTTRKSTGLFLISLVCIAVVLTTGCTSSGSSTAPVTTHAPTTAAAAPVTATTAPVKAAAPSVTTASSVNDIIKITLNSGSKRTTNFAGGSFAEGIALLELDITIENNDKKNDFNYKDSSFVMSFKNNKTTQTAKTSQFAQSLTNPLISGTVLAGSKDDGKIVFFVAKTLNYYTLSLVDSTGTVLSSIDNINVP